MTATVVTPLHGRAWRRPLTLVGGGPERTPRPAPTREIRVLIADPQALTRGALRALLEADPGIVVDGEAATGEDTVRIAHRTRPDVVLIDTELAGLDVVEATRQIAVLPRTRVMLLGASALDGSVFPALRAGASGSLVKDSDPRDLARAVRALAGGDPLLSPAVTRRRLAALVAVD